MSPGRSAPAGTGQGIGLSIVQRLSDRYGWPVSLESEPGKGTLAIISLPSVR